MLPFPSTNTLTHNNSNETKPKHFTKLLTYPPTTGCIITTPRSSSNVVVANNNNTNNATNSSNANTTTINNASGISNNRSTSSSSTSSSSTTTTSFTALLGSVNNLSKLEMVSGNNSTSNTCNTSNGCLTNSLPNNNNNINCRQVVSNSAAAPLVQVMNEKPQQSQSVKSAKHATRRSSPQNVPNTTIKKASPKAVQSSNSAVNTTPPKRVEQTRLSSDSSLSVDIELGANKKKKRKVIEDSPDMNSYFHEENSPSQTYPSVYYAPPVFQSYDYYSYPQMMAVPQFGPTSTSGSTNSNATSSSSKPKQFEADEDYYKRRPIIAQYMEKKLGFTRYVIDRLDDRELSHQFINSLVTAKDKTMMGSLCMSLLSIYLQEIKSIPMSDLSFQEGTVQNNSTHFNLMGASLEYSALISRILVMTCDPDCKPNKLADLLALSFMLIFNFGSYSRSGVPPTSSNK